MEIAHLSSLFEAQKKLDQTIAINHQITYETTRSKRIMALIVEIGELANATRCFKYWSNKASEEKSVVLDEYSDGLHFFLSLGIDIKTTKVDYDIELEELDPTTQFHKVYHLIDQFRLNQDEISYINAFTSFLALLPSLGFSWNELEEAYYKKLGVNYKRQETNY